MHDNDHELARIIMIMNSHAYAINIAASITNYIKQARACIKQFITLTLCLIEIHTYTLLSYMLTTQYQFDCKQVI